MNTNFTKKVALITVIFMLLSALLIFSTSADDTVIADLLPSNNEERGKLTLIGCTLEENSDGSVTFTLTDNNASFKMEFTEDFYAEGGGGTIHNDQPVDLSNPAFVVYDYASADGVQLSGTIAHYTRKDKAAANTHADLYLVSMEGNDYTEFVEESGDGYGIWDWGRYVSKENTKLFEDKIHRFVNLESSLTGNVGSKITFYKFYVSSTNEVEGLGAVRPEPTNTETSEPEESEESEEEESEDNSSEIDESVEDKSDQSDVSVEDNDDEASSDKEDLSDISSEVQGEESEDDGEDKSTVIYIVIGAIIVIALIVFLVMKKKK